MRDLHRVKFTGKGRDVSPLDGNIWTLHYQSLRSYVCEYVELYFQGGKPLLCHGTTKRGVQPLHTAKTMFCSTCWYRIRCQRRLLEPHISLHGKKSGLAWSIVSTRVWGFSLDPKVIGYRYSSHLNSLICSPSQKTSLCLSNCVNSEVQNTNDCVVRRRAVKNFCRPLRKKKSRKVLGLVYFAPFCFYFFFRRCGSVKVKLVLNFSMQLNSVYTIQKYKVFIQYFQKSVKPADLILKDAFRHWK